jgi:hypothetical protein
MDFAKGELFDVQLRLIAFATRLGARSSRAFETNYGISELEFLWRLDFGDLEFSTGPKLPSPIGQSGPST